MFGVPSEFLAYLLFCAVIITSFGGNAFRFFSTHSFLLGSTLGSSAIGAESIEYSPLISLIIDSKLSALEVGFKLIQKSFVSLIFCSAASTSLISFQSLTPIILVHGPKKSTRTPSMSTYILLALDNSVSSSLALLLPLFLKSNLLLGPFPALCTKPIGLIV